MRNFDDVGIVNGAIDNGELTKLVSLVGSELYGKGESSTSTSRRSRGQFSIQPHPAEVTS